MPLVLYNTAARAKQPFQPIKPDNVGMYVCGPTVYDNAHVGNARPIVIFDVLYRLLRRTYPVVTYVRNITDVDDKINAQAKSSGEKIEAITERTIQTFHKDMLALNALPPVHEPRATEHIGRMIDMIQILIEEGYAYEAEKHILFHVPSMANYGQLSGRNRSELIDGARVEIAPFKQDPADFVLWKPSTTDTPGWDSPWGIGRPGWHIECSAMSTLYLGNTFDIHGGGRDLIFPHHENEVAQSMCAYPQSKFAKYWVHNGFVTVEGKKMAKSAGNVLSVHELLNDFPGEAIRLTLLSAHYRQPLDFTHEGLRASKKILDRWYRTVGHRKDAEHGTDIDDIPKNVIDALNDDLNTPRAISALHGMLDSPHHFRAGANILGLMQEDAETWFHKSTDSDELQIQDLLSQREAARKARDFKTSDRIREELSEKGVSLEDNPDGTTKWRRQ